MSVLVTGGAGFIGSRLTEQLLRQDPARQIIVLDALRDGACAVTLDDLRRHQNFTFVQGDICNAALVSAVLREHAIEGIYHLAAESHVDRSLVEPLQFVQTNVMGTATLLHAALGHYKSLPAAAMAAFRFVHVSTDEVYGDLPLTGSEKFTPDRAYRPSSPYSASKAASDHLVSAWSRTYGLPCLITNCSNNFGPYQHPEKLIPKTILACINEQPIPVYGAGLNVRDWLYVEDHANGLIAAMERGRNGDNYLFGGDCELSNIRLVEMICDEVDRIAGTGRNSSRRELITFVTDRIGHDLRYAVDFSASREILGWSPDGAFATQLTATINWYLERTDWWQSLLDAQPGNTT